MTINQALLEVTKILKSHQPTSANLDAEVLLSYVLKKTKEYLYTYPEKKITDAQKKKFFQLAARRIRGEPVAHIIGKKEFYGLNFFVNKNVLIPRPETELLVEEVINYLSVLRPPSSVLRLADVGTGSGCIAISLAKQLPTAEIYATDISEKALQIAKRNAKLQRVKIRWRRGDLFEPLKKYSLDIIVANLPYLDKKSTQNVGLKFEPKIALAGGADGLKFYKKLLRQAKKFHLKPAAIFCEIDPRQTTAFKKLVKNYLPAYQLKIKKDLSDHDRVVIMKNVKWGTRPQRQKELPQHQFYN